METLIELKFLNSSFSSLFSIIEIRQTAAPVERFEATASQSAVPSAPPLSGARKLDRTRFAACQDCEAERLGTLTNDIASPSPPSYRSGMAQRLLRKEDQSRFRHTCT